MFYRTQDNKLETREEYYNLLKSINLPEKVIEFVLNIFYKEPLIGINKLLNECSPSYRITRRGTDIGLLDNISKLKDEQSIHAKLII
jgi:hypothetical protein